MAHRHGENDCVDGGGGGGDIENDGRASNASSFCESREPLLTLKSRINTTSQIAIVGAKVYPIESLDYDGWCNSGQDDSNELDTKDMQAADLSLGKKLLSTEK